MGKTKFDYMEFTGGTCNIEIVFHANKYNKVDAIEKLKSIFSLDSDDIFVDDLQERFVRYYVKLPYWCGYDGEGGGYTYCDENSRGSFPVLVFKK